MTKLSDLGYGPGGTMVRTIFAQPDPDQVWPNTAASQTTSTMSVSATLRLARLARQKRQGKSV